MAGQQCAGVSLTSGGGAAAGQPIPPACSSRCPCPHPDTASHPTWPRSCVQSYIESRAGRRIEVVAKARRGGGGDLCHGRMHRVLCAGAKRGSGWADGSHVSIS